MIWYHICYVQVEVSGIDSNTLYRDCYSLAVWNGESLLIGGMSRDMSNPIATPTVLAGKYELTLPTSASNSGDTSHLSR